MARPQKEQVTQRPQVSPTGVQVLPQVNASPVLGRTSDSTGDLAYLTNALAEFSPGLKNYAYEKQIEKNQEQFVKGQSTRQSLGDMDTQGGVDKVEKKWGKHFIEGYMSMHGKLQADKFKNELELALKDPEQFNPETDDINEFINKKRAESIAGVQDPHFLKGYLPQVDAAIAGMKDAHTKEAAARVQETALTGVNELASTMFANEKGRVSVQARNDFYNTGRQLGITYQALDSLMFQQARSYALSGDGHPEALDIFNEKSADGTQPGMAHNPKWKPHIDDVRRQAMALQERKRKEKDQLAAFDWLRGFEQRATGYTSMDPVLADIREGVQLGHLSGAGGISLGHEVKKQIDYRNGVAAMVGAIQTGDIGAFSAAMSNPNAQKMAEDAYQQYAANVFATVDDPSKAAAMVANAGAKVGVISSQLEYRFKFSNPANPGDFVRTATMFASLRDDPRYAGWLQKHVDDKQAAMFEAYIDARKIGMLSEEDAVRRAGAVATAYNQDTIKAAMNTPAWQEMYDKVASEFSSSGRVNTLSMGILGAPGVLNQATIQETVRRQAVQHMLATGSRPKDSLEFALNRVKATHVNINGYMIPHGNDPSLISEDFPKAARELIAAYEKGLKDNKLPVGEEGYRLVPDLETRKDGTLAILDVATATPVGSRVSPADVLNAYRVTHGEKKTIEQVRAEQQKNIKTQTPARQQAIREALDSLNQPADLLKQ